MYSEKQAERILNEYIEHTTALDSSYVEFAKKKWDSIAKPLRGMGILEDCITQIIGILGETRQLNKCVAVMCADNGIVEEGVTQTDSSVTAVVAHNITVGDATVTNMAKVANADVYAYDVGMLTEVDHTYRKKVACGTKNFAKTEAMTRQEVLNTIINGIQISGELKEKGYNIIASGEMGIGNTTTSSAITAVIFGIESEKVTGRGAGLTSGQVSHKAEVIKDAIIMHNPNPCDPIDILSKVGGFDIAALCGLFIGGAYYKIPIIIDGFISSVAALIASRLCANSKEYMLASHMSAEPAATMIMQELGLLAPLHCGMALGEGTGAVAMMPLLDMAMQVFHNMPTFQQIHIEEYKPLC